MGEHPQPGSQTCKPPLRLLSPLSLLILYTVPAGLLQKTATRLKFQVVFCSRVPRWTVFVLACYLMQTVWTWMCVKWKDWSTLGRTIDGLIERPACLIPSVALLFQTLFSVTAEAGKSMSGIFCFVFIQMWMSCFEKLCCSFNFHDYTFSSQTNFNHKESKILFLRWVSTSRGNKNPFFLKNKQIGSKEEFQSSWIK